MHISVFVFHYKITLVLSNFISCIDDVHQGLVSDLRRMFCFVFPPRQPTHSLSYHRNEHVIDVCQMGPLKSLSAADANHKHNAILLQINAAHTNGKRSFYESLGEGALPI